MEQFYLLLSVEDWRGVTCRRHRVTKLNLCNQQLGDVLSYWKSLLSLEIYLYNNFHGSIPDDIGRLFRLQYLDLERNTFQGKFPANLSHCKDIRNISMHHNNFEGKLPTEFASWSKLVEFATWDCNTSLYSFTRRAVFKDP